VLGNVFSSLALQEPAREVPGAVQFMKVSSLLKEVIIKNSGGTERRRCLIVNESPIFIHPARPFHVFCSAVASSRLSGESCKPATAAASPQNNLNLVFMFLNLFSSSSSVRRISSTVFLLTISNNVSCVLLLTVVRSHGFLMESREIFFRVFQLTNVFRRSGNFLMEDLT
jgi:hypothetical protein